MLIATPFNKVIDCGAKGIIKSVRMERNPGNYSRVRHR